MLGNDSSPFLVLIVRRSHVIEDALNQIAANITDLKKPLRVKFAGEEGVDAGGVQKEFFHLCIEQIMDLNYGMCIWIRTTEILIFFRLVHAVARSNLLAERQVTRAPLTVQTDWHAVGSRHLQRCVDQCTVLDGSIQEIARHSSHIRRL